MEIIRDSKFWTRDLQLFVYMTHYTPPFYSKIFYRALYNWPTRLTVDLNSSITSGHLDGLGAAKYFLLNKETTTTAEYFPCSTYFTFLGETTDLP